MTIRLVDELGPVLAGRGRATRVRKKVEAIVRRGEDVVIDLEGVEAISPSVADELFGKLPSAVGERLRFEGASPLLGDIARMARSTRRLG